MGALLEQLDGERDQVLISASVAGDAEAFAELYARYQPRLLRFCRARVSDGFLAEEIAQEAFTRAFAALGRLQDPRRFYPWLTVIAHRLVADHYRRSWRLSFSPVIDPGMDPPADAGLIAQAESEAVRAALGRVRPRHREVLRLREAGMSYDEIAVELGTPTSTVAPLLHRARSALRREYLAVIGTERIAGLAPLVTVPLAWSRRARARVARYVTWMPDANAFCAPAACLAIVAGSVFLPAQGQMQLAPKQQDQNPAGDPWQGAPTAAVLQHGATPMLGITDSGTDRTQSGTKLGVAQLTFDNRARESWRDQARQMPIYYEVGDVAFSADPGAMQRDLEKTGRGDLSWARGQCATSFQEGCDR